VGDTPPIYYGVQDVLQGRQEAFIWTVRTQQMRIPPEKDKPIYRSPVIVLDDVWWESEEDCQDYCDRVMAQYSEIKDTPIMFRGWAESDGEGGTRYLREEAA